MEKSKCKIDCKCKINGKTHSFNDGCGCPKHNGEQFKLLSIPEEDVDTFIKEISTIKRWVHTFPKFGVPEGEDEYVIKDEDLKKILKNYGKNN